MRLFHKSKRRGETLTELVITMAILSILTAMVISFSSAVGKQVNYTDDLNTAGAELPTAKNMFRAWIAYFDSPNYTIGTAKDTLTAKTSGENPKVYTLSFSNGTLVAEYPDGSKRSLASETITRFTAESVKSVNNKESGVYRIEISYQFPKSGQAAEPFVFLVATRTEVQQG